MADQIEIIIVDDASGDKTKQILNTFANHPQIRILRHKTNMGPAAARNTGLEIAQAEVVAFQDADDISMPDRIEKQYSLIKSGIDAADMVLSWTREESESGKRPRRIKFQLPANRRTAIKRIFMGHPSITSTIMVRREVAKNIGGFDPDLRYREDSDFMLRVLGSNEVRVARDYLVTRVVRKSGMSRRVTEDVFLENRARFARKATEIHPWLGQYENVYWAKNYRILGGLIENTDLDKARQYYLKSLSEKFTLKAFGRLQISSLRRFLHRPK